MSGYTVGCRYGEVRAGAGKEDIWGYRGHSRMLPVKLEWDFRLTVEQDFDPVV